MKIIPIEIEIDDIRCSDRTCLLNILELDFYSTNTALFEFGLYQGNLRIEVLFHRFFTWKIIDYLDEKFGNDPTTAIIRSLRNFLRKFV